MAGRPGLSIEVTAAGVATHADESGGELDGLPSTDGLMGARII
jgi:hypothetical protein